MDGTSNYASGLPWFGVLIAILDKNTPIVAGAYLPISNQFFIAEEGGGSYLNGEKLIIKDKKIENSL